MGGREISLFKGGFPGAAERAPIRSKSVPELYFLYSGAGFDFRGIPSELKESPPNYKAL